MQKKKLTGTVYQLSTTDSGEPMYFFLFGMSYFYVLFYFIGDWIAGFMGYAQDGFSAPYTIALVYGCMIYTLIGLIYLRKILRHFFSETITVWVLILIVLGTNYAHHLSPESEEFGFNFRKAYKELTKKDHVWVKVTFDYLSDNLGEPILVAAAMIRSNGAYGYQTFELKNDTSRWQKMEFYYLTPEIRSINDQLNIDFWKRNPCNLRMDNLKIDLYETK